MKLGQLASLLGLGFVVAFASGCGSDCEDTCEAAKDCQGGDTLGDFDCGDLCDLAEDQAEQRGCGSEFDDYNACYAGADDACTTTDCQDESSAYGTCISGSQEASGG